MKKKTGSKKHIARYFTLWKGVKLPWLLILGSLVCAIAMMNAELQVATMTADIIDTSQVAIDTKKLVSRVTSDAEAPASLFTTAISCVVCVVTSIQAFIQLFDYNTMLATYSLIIIPLTLLVCLIYGKLMFKLGAFGTTTMAGSMGYLAERVRHFRLIKSAVAEKLEAKKGERSFQRMYIADFLSWLMVAGYQLASSLFSILFIVIVFVIGGQLIPSGQITIGDLTGFYMITGIVSMQLMQFFMNVGAVSGTFGTMKKISQVMDTAPEQGVFSQKA